MRYANVSVGLQRPCCIFQVIVRIVLKPTSQGKAVALAGLSWPRMKLKI
jgi:hypothetical protein